MTTATYDQTAIADYFFDLAGLLAAGTAARRRQRRRRTTRTAECSRARTYYHNIIPSSRDHSGGRAVSSTDVIAFQLPSPSLRVVITTAPVQVRGCARRVFACLRALMSHVPRLVSSGDVRSRGVAEVHFSFSYFVVWRGRFIACRENRIGRTEVTENTNRLEIQEYTKRPLGK